MENSLLAHAPTCFYRKGGFVQKLQIRPEVVCETLDLSSSVLGLLVAVT